MFYFTVLELKAFYFMMLGGWSQSYNAIDLGCMLVGSHQQGTPETLKELMILMGFKSASHCLAV